MITRFVETSSKSIVTAFAPELHPNSMDAQTKGANAKTFQERMARLSQGEGGFLGRARGRARGAGRPDRAGDIAVGLSCFPPRGARGKCTFSGRGDAENRKKAGRVPLNEWYLGIRCVRKF